MSAPRPPVDWNKAFADGSPVIHGVPKAIGAIQPRNTLALARSILASVEAADATNDFVIRARCYHSAAVLVRELLGRLAPFEEWNP